MPKQDIASKIEIESFILTHKDWQYEDGKLIAKYKMKDFDSAMKVIRAVARVAEQGNHHPFWSNDFNKLYFELCTYSERYKVTARDFELAKSISKIIEKVKGK